MPRKKLVNNKSSDYEGVEDNSIVNDISIPHKEIVSALNKSVGDVAYIIGSDDSPTEVKEWLSTGSTVLDSIINNNPDANGGIPVGKLVEMSGEAATGKSLISYLILKDCLDKGGIPVLIDTESACNFEFLRMLGLEPENNLIYIQPDSIEQVFKTIEEVIRKIREEHRDKLCCIVWDSVAATSTDIELENDFGQSQVGVHARLIGQGLRKIIRLIATHRISLVFLNQLRTKIGVQFGDPDTTPGGRSIPFMSSVRIKLYSGGKLKAGNDVVGMGIKAKIAKNRMGPPHRECNLKMYFTRGLIDEESWLDILLQHGVCEKYSAQKSSYTDKETGEVHDFLNRKFVDFMAENPIIREKLRKEVKRVLYVEPDPYKRKENIVLEELSSGEDI